MVAYCKKHIRAGILCSAVLLAVMPYLGHAETFRNFDSLEGRFFEEYQYVPVALRIRAKQLLDKGHFMNTEMYAIMKDAYGLQAADAYRFAWILNDLLVHMDVMKEYIDHNTFVKTMPE